MRGNTKSIATITLGLSFCAAAGYFLYMLFNKDEDDYYDTVPTSNKKRTRLELKIPKENVRNVIGRNGAHIKEIETRTQTKINFGEANKSEEHRVCVIKGQSQDCVNAENLIFELIAQEPVIEAKDVWIPKVCVGRIIGRNGERIHHISDMTGAKVTVGSEDEGDKRRVTIKGTAEQTTSASCYIADIVEDDLEHRRRVVEKLGSREPRRAQRSPDTSLQAAAPEQLAASPEMEVYVSAAEDPARFWLQIVGPNANELDQLVDDMTEYYGDASNRDLHVLDAETLALGDVVASLFSFDGKWYRAEVRRLDAAARLCALYFVDYGDSVRDVPVSEAYELRTDFLRLRFQAFECRLARVAPLHGSDWSPQALDCFEECTYVAQWRKLRARVHGYRQQDAPSVPAVHLYDTAHPDPELVDVAARLVHCGHARFLDNGDRS